MPWIDQKLIYDPLLRRCTLAFNGVDLQIDATPVTPVLIAIGCDRRAHPDDVLPDVVANAYAPGRLNARRGWCGDALDTLGRLVGSRMWLYQVGKQDEATRRGAEGAIAEALGPVAKQRDWPIAITVTWVRKGFLGCLTKIGNTTLNLTLPAAS
jgi:phage gp46-like protein